MADWLADLRVFHSSIVEAACQEWRRSNPNKRPAPGHIYGLCKEMAPRPEPQKAAPLVQISSVPVESTTIRDNWRTLNYRDLSEAERGLFHADLARVKSLRSGMI